MILKQNCKAVLKAMPFDRLVILCYDYFPTVYAELSPQISHKAVIMLLLAEAELPKLARVLGLSPDEAAPKDSKYQVVVKEGGKVGAVGDNIQIKGGLHL